MVLAIVVAKSMISSIAQQRGTVAHCVRTMIASRTRGPTSEGDVSESCKMFEVEGLANAKIFIERRSECEHAHEHEHEHKGMNDTCRRFESRT